MGQNYVLPEMEHKFHIEVVGEESKINWVGDFLYRRPNLRERAMIDVMMKRLNGDLLTLDDDTLYFNEATAHMRFTLKEYPEWWKASDFGGSIYDGNVIIAMFKKVTEFEKKWQDKVFGGKKEDVEDGKSASPEEPQ